MKILTTRLTGAAWILVYLFWATGNLLWAKPQQLVSGTVTDTEQNPIPGVSIRLLNRNTGTQTDMQGAFSIQAQPSDTLSISYLGFKTIRLPVSNQNNFTIVLQQDITDLGEVTINAGYYNTTRREQTGSIARVTAEEIERQPMTNPLAALQGRMAGVNITQTTGVPGGGFDIQIRGTNSIGAGNDPLYIVDGVPFSGNSLGIATNNARVIPGSVSPLNALSPSDIASIEILKDADATAIYGSRGANGVVLITTKKGKGGKTSLSLNMQTGIAEVAQFVDLMDTSQYLEMRREAYANDEITTYPSNAFDVNGTWEDNPETDWQEKLLGNQAQFQEVNLRLNTGSAQTRFLIGANLRTENTVFEGNSDYTKASVLSAMNHQSADDRFAVNLSLNYVNEDNVLPLSDLTSQTRIPPNSPEVYTEDGSLNWAGNTWGNPYAAILNESYRYKSNNLIANATFSYALTKALSFKANLGYNQIEMEDKRLFPSTRYNPAANRDSRYSVLYSNTASRDSWIVEPQLTYENRWKKLDVSLLAGVTVQQQREEQFYVSAQGFPSNQVLDNLASATTTTILDNGSSQYRYQAFFGRVNLNWDTKYMLNLTGRRDGSSRFGTGNRFANFGAAGLAWIFTEEALFNNQNVLSFGKLRASYGITGNDQIGNYEYLDAYTLSGRSYGDLNGLAPAQLFNPNFSWETNKKLELALETGLLNNRIYVIAALFRNRSSNQLVGIPQPGTTGFTSLRANLNAEVENRGFELELRSVNLDGKDLRWVTTFNFTLLKNELLSYPGLENSTNANLLVIGESLNLVQLYELQGVNPETGIYEFRDFNGDGSISFTEDRKYIRSYDPKYFGGLGNEISYKNWNLSFLLQFVGQDKNGLITNIPGAMINQPVAVLDRWQQPGDEATYQRYTTGRNSAALTAYNRFVNSSGNFVDASFVRLKNAYLSYRIPTVSKTITNASIFLQGQNLMTFTPFEGADPESGFSTNLPPLRQFSLGLQIQF